MSVEPAGFEHKSGVWITNPFLSVCARFQVNPETYYGKTQRELADIYGDKYFAFVSDMTKLLIESKERRLSLLEWDGAARPVRQGEAKKKEEKV
jgi:hypothetical protein